MSLKHYRYGKFRFRDYSASWFAIALLLFFSISSIILNLAPIFVVFPIVYAVAWLWVILAAHREQFVIRNDYITIFRGKTTHTIELPTDIALVVSYADICPPMTVRTAVGNKTHILKDKVAVSILQKMPADDILEALHRNHIHRYTVSSIRMVFDDCHYIYSFVCTQSLLNELVANRKCLLILPESLSKAISVNSCFVNVHIDARC